MGKVRKYISLVLLVLFSCYYAGINFFSHTHIINGTSVAHSHLGGYAEHNHSDAQYRVIEFLSYFCSDEIADCCHVEAPFFQLSELYAEYVADVESAAVSAFYLRGPPQA